MKNCRIFIAVLVLVVLADALLGAPVTQVDEVKQNRSPRKMDYDDKVEQFLTKYGYMRKGVSKNSLRYEDEQKDAIRRVQKFYKLNITGELDKDTIDVIKASRCGLPDIEINSKSRNKRYVLYSWWKSDSLTYRIDNYPTMWSGFNGTSEMDAVIVNAFKFWTDVTGLKITETQSDPDLTLGFYGGDHGDHNPFDGPGDILAHAFFPEDGRIHMDDIEIWSSTDDGVNLLQVAVHEIGHALGLMHSDDPDAIMYPVYSYRMNFRLGINDVRGIQALYGPPIAKAIATTASPIPTTRLPFWKWFWRNH